MFLDIFVQTAPNMDSEMTVRDLQLINRTVELMLDVQKRLSAQAEAARDEVGYIDVPDVAVMPCGHLTSCNVSIILS